MLNKPMQIQLTTPYLAIAYAKQYYPDPIDLVTMKWLIFIEHFCFLSEVLSLIIGNNDCALALYCDKKEISKCTVEFHLAIFPKIPYPNQVPITTS